jgi:hypothetical protein
MLGMTAAIAAGAYILGVLSAFVIPRIADYLLLRDYERAKVEGERRATHAGS